MSTNVWKVYMVVIPRTVGSYNCTCRPGLTGDGRNSCTEGCEPLFVETYRISQKLLRTIVNSDYYINFWYWLKSVFFNCSTLNRARIMHFWTKMIVLSLVTDIATHTCLKSIRMRFVCGQGILELKKKKQKKLKEKQVVNGDCLPLSCACIIRKNISLRDCHYQMVFNWLCSIT